MVLSLTHAIPYPPLFPIPLITITLTFLHSNYSLSYTRTFPIIPLNSLYNSLSPPLPSDSSPPLSCTLSCTLFASFLLLRLLRCLTDLNLADNSISTTTPLCELIRRGGLETLDVSDNLLGASLGRGGGGDAGQGALWRVIGSNEDLRFLSLSRNPLVVSETLVSALARNKSLRCVALGGVTGAAKGDDAAPQRLCCVLESGVSPIEELDLSHNGVGAAGATVLASAMDRRHQGRLVDGVRQDTPQDIPQGMHQGITQGITHGVSGDFLSPLRCLGLRGNGLGSEGVAIVCRAVLYSRITSLDLSDNAMCESPTRGFSVDGIKEVAALLRLAAGYNDGGKGGTCMLKCIDLSANDLGSVAAEKIVQALDHKKKRKKKARRIRSHASHAPSLLILNIDSNGIPSTSAEAIRKAVLTLREAALQPSTEAPQRGGGGGGGGGGGSSGGGGSGIASVGGRYGGGGATNSIRTDERSNATRTAFGTSQPMHPFSMSHRYVRRVGVWEARRNTAR